jgi:hypothetical protein
MVPPSEWLQRAPLAFIFGIVVGAFLFLFNRPRKTVACTKCGAAKYADKSQDCSCGGMFEEIGKLKWIEEFPNSGDEEDMSEPIKCLACGTSIPATGDKCPKCGWTYKQ